jgi:hypothetical protein
MKTLGKGALVALVAILGALAWQSRAYSDRLRGGVYLGQPPAEDEGEHVIIEITPTKINTMDGAPVVSPIQLLGLRAARKLGRLIRCSHG